MGLGESRVRGGVPGAGKGSRVGGSGIRGDLRVRRGVPGKEGVLITNDHDTYMTPKGLQPHSAKKINKYASSA